MCECDLLVIQVVSSLFKLWFRWMWSFGYSSSQTKFMMQIDICCISVYLRTWYTPCFVACTVRRNTFSRPVPFQILPMMQESTVFSSIFKYSRYLGSTLRGRLWNKSHVEYIKIGNLQTGSCWTAHYLVRNMLSSKGPARLQRLETKHLIPSLDIDFWPWWNHLQFAGKRFKNLHPGSRSHNQPSKSHRMTPPLRLDS